MSRAIDKFPDPPVKRPTKIIGMGCSRTATLGLYKALGILGYNTLHMIVIINGDAGGKHHDPKIFYEAIESHTNPKSGIKPYDKADFEKWWAEYDAVLECPSYFPEAILDAYKDDPDVKFILTERQPEGFAKSFRSSIGSFETGVRSFPLSFLKFLDARNYYLFRMGSRLWDHCAGGVPPWDDRGDANLRSFYSDYMAKVKPALPKDRTLVLNLEEGLGWEKLCEFLGDEIPDVPYPRTNDPNEFKNIVSPHIEAGLNRAMGVVAGAAAVAAGVGFWLLKSHGRFR
ncbi:hypothetical protein RB601_004098 [Gaeumannomyces tritici]